jgi:hypothetical protein
MPNEEFPRDAEDKLQKALETAALNDYPNPQRIGCPKDKAILRAIAAKKLRPSDPVVQHVAECSPCFREVKEFERQLGRSRSWRLAGAIAAGILIVASLFLFRNRLPIFTPKIQLAEVMDLREYTADRGATADSGTARRPPLSLGRGEVSLSILLPVGAPEGIYEFKLLNDSLEPVLSGTGQATIKNFITTISAQMDTSRLSPGHYSFYLRQRDNDWQLYPMFVR